MFNTDNSCIVNLLLMNNYIPKQYDIKITKYLHRLYNYFITMSARVK